MTKFVELLISGVSQGLIYGLIALGFVVIFKATEVINFAHGSLLLLGAYVIARVQQELGFWIALLAGLLVTAAVVLLIERLLLRRLHSSARANPIVLAILTIGIDIMLLTELTRRIGARVYGLGTPWGSNVVQVGGYSIAQSRVIGIVTAIVIIGGFLTAFKFTRWGLATRASAEDVETSALMGIRLGRVSAVSWVVGGSLAVIAGVFFAGFPSPGLNNATGLTALKAFPAAIIGGIDSTTGALVGGLIIGLAETYASGYSGYLAFMGRGIGSVMPWIVMLIVLLIRPSGLFGTREATRV